MDESELQDSLLTAFQRKKTTVTIFMMNGFQMRGTIFGHDRFCVVLNSDGKLSMIFKHAISTIQPVGVFDYPADVTGNMDKETMPA